MDFNVTPEQARNLTMRTGQKHRVIFVPDPDPTPARSIPAAVFAFDSAFPGPGIFIHLREIEDRAADEPDKRIVVFGHADPSGGDAYNKGLSDKRAKAVFALLTNDRDLFDELAAHEGWGTKHYQAMLRGLGCNPGAIDGVPGALLAAAVRSFQKEYNEGVFHEGATPRAHGDLAVNGTLDEPTKAAIRDAYVVGTPGELDPGRFGGPRFAGCSDFNLISKVDAENRRVVVAFFDGGDRPLDQDFPCKEGNVAACTVDGQTPMRCTFYRKVVKEVEGDPVRPFFDFHWLKQKNGVAHLSALTTLPDGAPAKFTIYKCTSEKTVPPPDAHSASGKPRPEPGEVLGTVDGQVVGGVCFAKWTPPEGSDPFDHDAWFVPFEVDIDDRSDTVLSIDDLLASPVRPPVFAIDSGDHWGFSRPPGKRIQRLRFEAVTRDEPEPEGADDGGGDSTPGADPVRGTALASDGSVVEFVTDARGRIRFPAQDQPEVDVVLVVGRGSVMEPEGQETDNG